jgi:hypothetical protein
MSYAWPSSQNTPSREPPSVLAENAGLHSVETRRVEKLLEASPTQPALIAGKICESDLASRPEHRPVHFAGLCLG